MKRITQNAIATVIIVHGGFEHYSRYRWFMNQLVHARFNVIAGDLPGHGVYTKRRGDIHSFEQYLEMLDKWYEEARKIGLPIILFGHSMGGLIIIRYLQTRDSNIQLVVLSSPCLGIAEPPERLTYTLARLIYPIYPKLKVRIPIIYEKMTSNRDVQIDIKNDPLFVKKITIRWFIELERAIEKVFENIEQTKKIPFLLMQAGSDYIVKKEKSEQWFSLYENVEKRYTEFPDFYHELLQEDRKQEVFRFMLDFIANQSFIMKTKDVGNS